MYTSRQVKRTLDKLLNGGKTKCTSELQFIKLYSGPNFLIHFKYALNMNIIFVTMMFGTGLPILFPIALISFIIIYILENFMLLKVYKKPIEYHGELHAKVLNILGHASILFLAFSFWQLSNLQLIKYIEKDTLYLNNNPDHDLLDETIIRQITVTPLTNHIWYRYFNLRFAITHSGHALPILIVLFLYFNFKILGLVIKYTCSQKFEKIAKKLRSQIKSYDKEHLNDLKDNLCD